MRWATTGILAAALVTSLAAGCGLTTTQGLQDIDPASLPAELVGTRTQTPSPSAGPVNVGGSVYFVRDDRLIEQRRASSVEAGPLAVQELLASLTAGPADADRDRGISTALPPTTVLRLTGLDGDVATVDLTVGQLPPNQTVAIAQIVLTATSLEAVGGVRLTINGEPINAPLASGAQTNRPLTRDDYAEMLARGF